MMTLLRHLRIFSLLILLGSTGYSQSENFDPSKAAKQILDESNHDDLRASIANESLAQAPLVIKAMTADLKLDDRDEQYRRIPWIWRLAINATKQQRIEVQRDLLLLSLPAADQPLTDWQAVVLGGGLINGLSQLGTSPADRIAELLRASESDKDSQQRWKRTLELATKMAADADTPSGTRYDALRILGAGDWDSHEKTISRYLVPGTDEELQMGAANAAADLSSPEATKTLLKALAGLSEDNRNLALSVLVSREPQRDRVRLALQSHELTKEWLTAEQLKQLDQ